MVKEILKQPSFPFADPDQLAIHAPFKRTPVMRKLLGSLHMMVGSPWVVASLAFPPSPLVRFETFARATNDFTMPDAPKFLEQCVGPVEKKENGRPLREAVKRHGCPLREAYSSDILRVLVVHVHLVAS